jgi:hypothetical protein
MNLRHERRTSDQGLKCMYHDLELVTIRKSRLRLVVHVCRIQGKEKKET